MVGYSNRNWHKYLLEIVKRIGMKLNLKRKIHATGGDRTHDLQLSGLMLLPLSYCGHFLFKPNFEPFFQILPHSSYRVLHTKPINCRTSFNTHTYLHMTLSFSVHTHLLSPALIQIEFVHIVNINSMPSFMNAALET